MRCRTREEVVSQWVLARSRYASLHCCNATASGVRHFRCCALRNIRGQADALSCRVPKSDPDRDNTARYNRPAPSGSRPPPEPRDPFRKRESVLCLDDSDSARASLHGDSPASWSVVAAYLPCLARAYGVILHRTYGSIQSHGFASSRKRKGIDNIRIAAEQGSNRSLPRIFTGLSLDTDCFVGRRQYAPRLLPPIEQPGWARLPGFC